MINKKCRIDNARDLEYDDLIADIYFEDQIFATLSQEFGFQNMEIEVYSSKAHDFWHFKFSDF